LTVACLGTYSVKCLIPNLKNFIEDNQNIGVRIRTLVLATQAAVSHYNVSIQYGPPQD
jgi:LysR family glycine cleavage system transcriptional activator